MESITGYAEKLGSNFLVAAMIPSLALVTAVIIIFEPILQIAWKFQGEGSIYKIIGAGLLLAIPTIIIGFTLTALNTFILKIFEGYILLHHIPFFKRTQVTKAKKLKAQKELIAKRIEVLEARKKKTQRTQDLLEILKNKSYALTAEYDQTYPPSLEQVLPTQFGNILKASEAYSGSRYGMDGVTFWSRLIYVIPPSYQQAIDESRNELSFIVNLSVLSLVFALLCMVGIIYNLIAPITLPVTPQVEPIYTYRYFVAGIFALFIAIFFHRAAIVMVGSFGVMIRSAYDLFRLQLLEQLRLEVPPNSKSEYYIWKNLGDFIVTGELSHYLKYDLKGKKKPR
jgi:hypothetical protein